MRRYLDIDLATREVDERELAGDDLVNVGRYFITKTLVECGAATVEPLSGDNPLILSAGPFAGTNFSNANRTSVGCKSPLTLNYLIQSIRSLRSCNMRLQGNRIRIFVPPWAASCSAATTSVSQFQYCQAERRPGWPWPNCFSSPATCSSWMSRPTILTSPPGRYSRTPLRTTTVRFV